MTDTAALPTVEAPSVAARSSLFDSSPAIGRRFAICLGLALGLPALFLDGHPYIGVSHDALFYALIAIRRLDPGALDADAFFRHGSQDSFTLFTAPYAALIHAIGLSSAAHWVGRGAALLLAATSLGLARRLMPRDLAWLAFALYLVIPGRYGPNHILRYDEDFATPRVLTECLAVAGLMFVLAGRTRLALAVAALGLLVHPLMAAAGVGAVIAFAAGPRLRVRMAAAGGIAILIATLIAVCAPRASLVMVDPLWRQALVNYAPYLLMDQWALAFWQPTAAALATLCCAMWVLPPGPTCRLALAATLVGAGGLLLEAYASFVAPLALLLQGQPWRWAWISTLVAVLLLAPVGGALWQRGPLARVALALLALAWIGTEDPVAVVAALGSALCTYLDQRDGVGHRGLLTGLGALATFLLGTALWNVNGLTPETRAAAGALLAWWALFRCPHAVPRAAAVLGAAAFLGHTVATGARIPDNWTRAYDEAGYAAFAPWRARIAPDEEVLSPRDGMLPWLMLHRPSYGNFAAVVFSRETALDFDAEYRDFVRIADLPPPGSTSITNIDLEYLSAAQLVKACETGRIAYVVTRSDFPIPSLLSHDAPPRDLLHLYACTDVRAHPLR